MHAALKLQCGRVTGNKKFTIGGLIYGCTQKAEPEPVRRSQRSQFVQMLTSLNVSLGAYPSHRSESPLLADIVNEPSVTRQSIYHAL